MPIASEASKVAYFKSFPCKTSVNKSDKTIAKISTSYTFLRALIASMTFSLRVFLSTDEYLMIIGSVVVRASMVSTL